jgi:hypothetical protein
MQVTYYPGKNYEQIYNALQKADNTGFLSGEEVGNGISKSSNYDIHYTHLADKLKGQNVDPSLLGDAYTIGPGGKPVKVSDLSSNWEKQISDKFVKSGFKGKELEDALAREFKRNPYKD